MVAAAEKLELSFSATKLRNKDTLGKSDPIVVVGLSTGDDGEVSEVGRTEVVNNNLNPVWLTKVLIDFHFEAKQVLVLSVYDWDKGDSRTAEPRKKDLIGTTTTSVGHLLTAKGKASFDLGKKNGVLMVSAEAVESSKEVLSLSLNATDLDKMDTFSKSDPFLVFSRASEDGTSFTVVYKSEVIKKSLNPVWAPMNIPLSLLCAGDEQRTLKIECYDFDDNGKHDLIGECTTKVCVLREGVGDKNTYSLINPKKVGKKKYTNSGVLQLMALTSREEMSFLDYIRRGTQVHFTVAVDFTSSNGDPKEESSLHYTCPGKDNQYVTAIRSVAEVIHDYDTDGFIPALGFGGKLSDGRVSHGFYMNGSPDNPNCKGVDGLLQAYHNAVHSITLFGPTNFAPVINHVSAIAAKNAEASTYFVLLILTDGAVTDMDATKKALVAAAEQPMSVIIVGVGSENFSAMRELDADKKRLSFEGKAAARDIVQFVELRKFVPSDGGGGALTGATRAALAKAVLAELPQQFLEWRRHKDGVNQAVVG